MKKETSFEQPTLLLRIKEILKKREEEIEELKKLKKELEETKTLLEEKVKERTKDLEQKYTQLEFQRNELDKTTKMLVRRDLELSEAREKKEEALQEAERRTKDLEMARTALMNMLEDVEKSRMALMNMLEDVEEARKKAEEERDKTQAIITNFTDGLLLLDAENKLSLINPHAEKFFNIKKEDIVGKTISELNTLPAVRPVMDLVGEEVKGIFRKEAQLNENSVLEISTVPILIEKEKFGTLVILHDVTREKLIERMKTEFVSLAAHQLRTPLSAIKWTLRIILDGDLGEINQEQHDFLEKTYASNERMISLINDLLNVTRIEEGRYIYKPTLTDLETVTQFVVNSYKEEAQRRQIKLEFKKTETPLPQVSIDVEKIRLSIQNLLDNAIRYTPAGGSVTVSLSRGKKEVEVSIKDTGLGIPKDQQKRVFAKFFRAANVMRTDTEGSGLGLFIAKNIIEAHNGRIWFESEENKGSTFHLVLPVKE